MDEHSQGRASRELKAESRRQIWVRQVSDAVRMEMNMERYAGDVTEWAGYNTTKKPLVLREAKQQKVTKHKECWLRKVTKHKECWLRKAVTEEKRQQQCVLRKAPKRQKVAKQEEC